MKLISVIARTLLRLVLFIVAIGFALVLVCVGVLGLLYVLLKALLTGRKPVFMTTFVRFQQASQQFKRGDSNIRQSTGEVIEGQAVEIHDDPALPHEPDK